MDSLLAHFKLIKPSLMRDVEIDPKQYLYPNYDLVASEMEPLSKWNSVLSSYKSVVFKTNVTADVSYVLSILFLCKCLIFYHKPIRTIEQLESFKRLETGVNRNLYFEQCIISNPINFMFITVSSTRTQQQINDFLQKKLSESVDESGIERSEVRKLFEQISLLQLTHAQELTCVGDWLKNFVPVWDGRYYQKEVNFRLINPRN